MTTVGIDIGGSKVSAVLLAESDVVDSDVSATDTGDDLLVRISQAVSSVITTETEAIGVGAAGLVRWPEGTFAWGPHLSGADIPLRSELESRFGLPVVVDSDANMAAYGELHSGAGRGYANLLLVTLGTGIGGAIVINGDVYRGESFAGEWGHMQFDAHGLLCDCGKRGCWETVASGPALVRLARETIALNPDSSLAGRLGDGFSGADISAAADGGDEVARGLVAQVGAEFGKGLCSLIAIFDPEAIVIGGGLGSVGESLVGPARRVATDAVHGGSHRLVPPILVGGLGPKAGAIGAATMAAALIRREIMLEP